MFYVHTYDIYGNCQTLEYNNYISAESCALALFKSNENFCVVSVVKIGYDRELLVLSRIGN